MGLNTFSTLVRPPHISFDWFCHFYFTHCIRHFYETMHLCVPVWYKYINHLHLLCILHCLCPYEVCYIGSHASPIALDHGRRVHELLRWRQCIYWCWCVLFLDDDICLETLIGHTRSSLFSGFSVVNAYKLHSACYVHVRRWWEKCM